MVQDFIMEVAFALDLDAGGNVNREVKEMVSPGSEVKSHTLHSMKGKLFSLATKWVSCDGLKPGNSGK